MKILTEAQIERLAYQCVMEFTDDNLALISTECAQHVIAEAIREVIKELTNE